MQQPAWSYDAELSATWKIITDLIEERKIVTTRSVLDASHGKKYGVKYVDTSHVRSCFLRLQQHGYLYEQERARGSRPGQWNLTTWGKHYLEVEGSYLAYYVIALQDAINSKSWAEGLKYVQRLIKTKGASTDFIYLRGLCYKNLGLFKKAIDDFTLTIKEDYRTIESYKNRRYCYFYLGWHEEALKECLSSVEESLYRSYNERDEVRKFIILNCFELDSPKKVINYLETAIKIDSYFIPYYLYCAIYYAYLNHDSGVFNHLEKFIQFGLRSYPILIEPFCRDSGIILPIKVFTGALANDLLAFYYLDRAYESVINCKIKSRVNGYGSAHDAQLVSSLLCHRGDVNQFFGRWDCALEYYNQAEKWGFIDTKAYIRRGSIHEYFGNFEQALQDYNRYLGNKNSLDDSPPTYYSYSSSREECFGNNDFIYYHLWLCRQRFRVKTLTRIQELSWSKAGENRFMQGVEDVVLEEFVLWKSDKDFSESEQILSGFILCGVGVFGSTLLILSLLHAFV
jgi:tetratricopeptide (TPR) repeat protein